MPYYGDGCSTMCSSNCSYRTCNAINGKCFMCPTGKSGDFCENSCKQGYHGIGCQQLCSNKCLNKICHPALGICLKCPSGFEGDSCSNGDLFL
ncbi:hypothetical protein Btru_054943 [Bulinus truncatus]|nr:hypothetical protein Btru_054943 [Bulinus truncatus]